MLFRVGKVRISPSLLARQDISSDDLIQAFERYIQGDWGHVGDGHGLENDLAIANGEPIQASYFSSSGTRFCLVTDQTGTHVMLPQEIQKLQRQPGRSVM